MNNDWTMLIINKWYKTSWSIEEPCDVAGLMFSLQQYSIQRIFRIYFQHATFNIFSPQNPG